jgi:hypothetical protein
MKKIILVTTLILTGAGFAQTISNVQIRQEGLVINVTYDMGE